MDSSLQQFCRSSLAEIESSGLLRILQNWEPNDTRTLSKEGQHLINFSSNDYLGLSTHPALQKESSIIQRSFGAGASRLISGNHTAYRQLEKALADFKCCESALVFTSGYAAALGTLPALVGKGDFIVMDKLCHACLVDAARLSEATLRVFPHNDMRRCDALLSFCRSKGGSHSKILLLTESLFSMDGDLAPLNVFAELRDRYDAWLMVDEAHATGVLGIHGRGGAEHFGVETHVDISMGTLSKALGCVGGFICGSSLLRELLVNRARSLIYSTGLPTTLCATACAAIQTVRSQPELRERLWKNVEILGDALKIKPNSPILPIPIGNERLCVERSLQLRKEGFLIPAVRYPTVKRGKAMLRASISATHTKEDLLRLAHVLRNFAR